MSHKRPREPIGPANVPGESQDPKIPPEEIPQSEDELLESETERQVRESGKSSTGREKARS